MKESFIETIRKEGNLEPIVIDFVELVSKSTDVTLVPRTVAAFFALPRDKQELILSGVIGLLSGIMSVVDAGLMDRQGKLNESNSNS